MGSRKSSCRPVSRLLGGGLCAMLLLSSCMTRDITIEPAGPWIPAGRGVTDDGQRTTWQIYKTSGTDPEGACISVDFSPPLRTRVGAHTYRGRTYGCALIPTRTDLPLRVQLSGSTAESDGFAIGV